MTRCKNCGEPVTIMWPMMWHTESTLVRCAGNGTEKAEVEEKDI
ncbi:hypothetical protein PP914_gp218 [Arthrobacter phage Qui]|jgi:hypothetical protein|uniref:Uncharacterized protein n=1 Tax=Arthrobacter phage Qui TaxID=2603260 RepID=A0A5B8WKD4_9CAUD|nr:hypothetical protein PP914_gp218 [Arthrobacter phage Qui]QED11706.1 hypothetical protein SEA_QUI_218 [Arthrobacter phage Qui]QOC56537.1 hypothetical protein SEA_PAELLA_218 [Arthrobacter phage Paella]